MDEIQKQLKRLIIVVLCVASISFYLRYKTAEYIHNLDHRMELVQEYYEDEQGEKIPVTLKMILDELRTHRDKLERE